MLVVRADVTEVFIDFFCEDYDDKNGHGMPVLTMEIKVVAANFREDSSSTKEEHGARSRIAKKAGKQVTDTQTTYRWKIKF